MNDGRGRRRFVIGCLLGALPAIAVFGWLVTIGAEALFPRQSFASGLYDAQANSFLHGHWDMPGTVLNIDGFRVGSKYYMYFGIWPSLLRLPVLAVSDSLSGRLSVVSMLLAFFVLLGGASALFWRVWLLFHPDGNCSRSEAAIAGFAVFVIGCGTPALYLASRAWVYHEAILWAVALSLLAYERIIAFLRQPSRGRLALAGLWTTLSILSRVSVGVGPVIALALIAAIELVRMIARRRSTDEGQPEGRSFLTSIDRAGTQDATKRSWFVATALTTAIPVLAYAAMNYARFGSPFGIPWRAQAIARLSPEHRAMLDANGGSLFNLELIPTTLLQAFRPDALGFSPLFPWVTFQRFPTVVVGDVVFNKLDFTTSLTAAMPALLILAVIGGLAAIWTRIGAVRDLAVLRTSLLGAATAAGVALAFTYVSARYLGDWIPLLAIAGFTGLLVLLARRAMAPRHLRWNVVLGLIAVLAGFGVWVMFSLGLVYQRLYNPIAPGERAAMLSFQYDVADALGTGTPDLELSAQLPHGHGRAGTTWIVGRCDALYWSDGTTWIPVEGTSAEGWVRLRVDFSGLTRDWSPLVAFGPAGRQDVVGVHNDFGKFRFGLGQPDATGNLVWTAALGSLRLGPGPKVLDIRADRVNGALDVQTGKRFALSFAPNSASLAPRHIARGPVTIGRASTGGLKPYPAPIEQLRPRVGDCRQIRQQAGGRAGGESG